MQDNGNENIGRLLDEIAAAFNNVIKDSINAELPSQVWHYTTMNALFGICESKELWLTDHRVLNDKNELLESIVTMREILYSESISKMGKGKLFPQEDDYAKQLSAPVFIGSFSENDDALSQWKGYANSPYGISIAFDVDSLVKIAAKEAMVFARVIYSKRKLAKIIELFAKFLVECGNRNKVDFSVFSRHCKVFIELFVEVCQSCYKTKEWKEEAEYRIITYRNIVAPSYRMIDKMFVPYHPLQLNLQDSIKEVKILDNDPYKAKVVKEYLNSRGLENVKISFSRLKMRF